MALVNPNIAMAYRQPEIQAPNALAQFAQIQQIQSGRQAQELAQYQLGAAQRAEATQNALANAYSQSVDPATGKINYNKLTGLLASGGGGSQIPGIEKTRREIETAELARDKTRAELLDTRLKQARSFLDTIDPAAPDAPQRYLAWHEANHRDPIIGAALTERGISAEQARQGIMAAIEKGPAAFAQMLNQSKLGTEKFMEMNKPQLSTTDVGGQVVSRTFEPLTGKLTEIGTQAKTMAPGESERLKNEATRIKQEGQRIGLEGRRVAVLEQNASRDADPAFQRNMEAARTVGRKAAEGDVAALQALPKVIGRAEEGVRLIDELIGKRDSKTGQLLKGEKTHPGFEGAVGATWLPGARFVPGTDAAGFMSRFDQIKGASFLEAFESLKGGGAITEKEGQKGTDAINRMSTSTDEKEFIRAAMDLQDVIRKGVQNAQSRASRAGASAAPAAPAAGGVIDFGSLK